MKAKEAGVLAKRYKSWSSEDLIAAVTFDRADYVEEALQTIEDELGRRNLTSGELRESALEIEGQRRRQDDRLRGIRGWLAFLLVVIKSCSLHLLYSGAYIFYQARSVLEIFLASFELSLGFYGLFVLFLLLTTRATAPGNAARWLFLAFVYSTMVIIIVFYHTGRILASPFFYMPNVLWLTYLGHSRRVLLTYGENAGVVFR